MRTNTTPFEYNENTSTWYNSEYLYYEFDNLTAVVNAMLIKMAMTTVLSLSCALLNFLLIVFCLSEKEFRDLKFFPIGFQALIDLLGPGLASLLYEIRIYFTAFSTHWGHADPASQPVSMPRILRSLEMQTVFDCILMFFRSLLNEYSTGICILTTSFIRYILVCHPTSDFLTHKKLVFMASLIIVVASCGAISNILLMEFSPSEFGEYGLQHSKQPSFVGNCVAFLFRDRLRIIFEASLFMVFPAIASAFFYISICKLILKRELDEERNRNLSIALCISWVCWMFCWTPNYAMMFTDLTRDGKFSQYSAGYVIYKYMSMFRTTIQMLYSQINPFLILVVLKPFRTKLIDYLAKPLMKKLETDGNEQKNAQNQQNRVGSSKRVSFNASQKRIRMKREDFQRFLAFGFCVSLRISLCQSPSCFSETITEWSDPKISAYGKKLPETSSSEISSSVLTFCKIGPCGAQYFFCF